MLSHVFKKDNERLKKVVFRGLTAEESGKIAESYKKYVLTEVHYCKEGGELVDDREGENVRYVVKKPVTMFDVTEEMKRPSDYKVYQVRYRRPRRPYIHGWKYCKMCDKFYFTDELMCPIHRKKYRMNTRKGPKLGNRYSDADRVDPGGLEVGDGEKIFMEGREIPIRFYEKGVDPENWQKRYNGLMEYLARRRMKVTSSL